MKSIISNVKRASIEMLLLSLLTEEDKYGYQMTQEIKNKSQGILTIKEGSMYPILYRLVDHGDVECKEVKVGVHMTRVYYHITEAGRERLSVMKNAFREQIAVIDEITHFSDPS